MKKPAKTFCSQLNEKDRDLLEHYSGFALLLAFPFGEDDAKVIEEIESNLEIGKKLAKNTRLPWKRHKSQMIDETHSSVKEKKG